MKHTDFLFDLNDEQPKAWYGKLERKHEKDQALVGKKGGKTLKKTHPRQSAK